MRNKDFYHTRGMEAIIEYCHHTYLKDTDEYHIVLSANKDGCFYGGNVTIHRDNLSLWLGKHPLLDTEISRIFSTTERP